MPGVEIDCPYVARGLGPPSVAAAVDEDQPLVDRVADHSGEYGMLVVLQGDRGVEAVAPRQGAGVEPADVVSAKLDVDRVCGGSVDPLGLAEIDVWGVGRDERCLAGTGVDEHRHFIGGRKDE